MEHTTSPSTIELKYLMREIKNVRREALSKMPMGSTMTLKVRVEANYSLQTVIAKISRHDVEITSLNGRDTFLEGTTAEIVSAIEDYNLRNRCTSRGNIPECFDPILEKGRHDYVTKIKMAY